MTSTFKMDRCDNRSADSRDHAGPFRSLYATNGEEFLVEACEGCGNIVVRVPLLKSSDGSEPPVLHRLEDYGTGWTAAIKKAGRRAMWLPNRLRHIGPAIRSAEKL
jgi:hypothetical protein